MFLHTNHAVEENNDPNTCESNVVFCGFGLSWFDLLSFNWIGLVLNTPNTTNAIK